MEKGKGKKHRYGKPVINKRLGENGAEKTKEGKTKRYSK